MLEVGARYPATLISHVWPQLRAPVPTSSVAQIRFPETSVFRVFAPVQDNICRSWSEPPFTISPLAKVEEAVADCTSSEPVT